MVVIPLNRTKIILLTLATFPFVIAASWMLMYPDQNSRYDSVFIQFISVSGLLFFGIGGIYLFSKIFDSKPGLILDERGILDNSSASGEVRILWEDIVKFRMQSVKKTEFLLVYVRNPEAYIDRANNFKRFWMKWNHRVYKTPLSISSTVLQCNMSELSEIIKRERKKYATK